MKKRKFKNLGDILKTFTTSQFPELNYVVDNTTIEGEKFVDALNYKYSMFDCVHATGARSFIDCWLNYITQYKPELDRIYMTLKAEYNPIHNYDKDELITSTQNKPVNGQSGTLTTTVYQVADDTVSTSTPYIPQAKTETNGTMTNEVHNVTKGNIGVTTTQSMIEAEKTLRLYNNFVDIVITRFAERELI